MRFFFSAAWIDRLIQDVVASPRFSTAAKRAEVAAVFRKAQRYYQEIVDGSGAATGR